jgi:hypothetical protein
MGLLLGPTPMKIPRIRDSSAPLATHLWRDEQRRPVKKKKQVMKEKEKTARSADQMNDQTENVKKGKKGR